MGKGRLSSAQRVKARGGGRGRARGRVGDVDADAPATPPPPPSNTTTTSTTTAIGDSKTGIAITTASVTLRATSRSQSSGVQEAPRIYLGVQEEEDLDSTAGAGLGPRLTSEVKETWTVERALYEASNTSTGREAGPSTPGTAAHPTAHPQSFDRSEERVENTILNHNRIKINNPNPHIPLPRQSPDPHPQPKRYILKFKRRILEKSQAREAEQRQAIEDLLERQQLDAVCASTLLRERDLVIMPSLERALSLRSGRPRGGDPGVGPVEKETVVDGTTNGNTSGLETARAMRNAGRRPKDKENSSKINGNDPHVEEPQPAIANPEPPTKPSRLKKMELELRIDDASTAAKDNETLGRNIDNVIFGEVTFKAWYPSWYPKEIIGEKALTGDKGGIVVTELYVCKRCFGYGKVLVEWMKHCRCCEREVPGRKVYAHGGWREDDSPRPASGQWSIWEVDGGVDTLFCQNLSLFAKLFLDNKSVFFDVSGFKYFLLVYTPPRNSPHSTTTSPPHKQIIGFFSKEKLSWDNNNLACILIFPPWQRKGLGALLMGVSYAIARRERILGGPEKPISDLGRKGYKRFWGAEIARWILERKDKRGKGGKGKAREKREKVSIKQISEDTWIAPEDCLGVLRDMGVVERAGSRGSSGMGAGVSPEEKDGNGVVKEGVGKEKEIVKVKIDKEAIRRWCERERISLDRVVTEEGFLPGYAVKVEEVEEEGEEGDGKGVEEGEAEGLVGG